MDFSWVKQLAEQSNQKELARQDQNRREKEDQRTLAMSTIPFVEKLYVVINGATEEFNKHCVFSQLRVQTTKLYKHSKTGEELTAEPDEVAYFTFQRSDYMFGIRGNNGCVEFVQIPVSADISAAIKLHELHMSAHKTMMAQMDPETKKIRWTMNGAVLDGAAIVSVCQRFFIDLIEQTNADRQ